MKRKTCYGIQKKHTEITNKTKQFNNVSLPGTIEHGLSRLGSHTWSSFWAFRGPRVCSFKLVSSPGLSKKPCQDNPTKLMKLQHQITKVAPHVTKPPKWWPYDDNLLFCLCLMNRIFLVCPKNNNLISQYGSWNQNVCSTCCPALAAP